MDPMPTLCSYEDVDRQEIILDLGGWSEHDLGARWDVYRTLVADRYRTCPMCGDSLRVFSFISSVLATRFDPNGNTVGVHFCSACGFWFASENWNRDWDAEQGVTYLCGLVRRFRLDDKNVPLAALRQFLVNHPDRVSYTNDTAFERLIAACLRDEFAPCEVLHVGGSGDGGIDIKLVTSDRETFLVQVKRRRSRGIESVQVVRELNGVLFREGRAKGMVVTTARGFSRAARKELEIKTPTEERYVVELRSFEDVRRMLRISAASPYQPWLRHLTMQPDSEAEYLEALRQPRVLGHDVAAP